MLPPTELRNLREIESLNQRGGRSLTLVDLLAAGTLTPDLAACLLARLAEGASLLTAANPSGTGKSTLLAALLACLPPGERLLSVTSPEVLSRALPPHSCLLVHEIGSGPWYGYLWGAPVRDYFALAAAGHRLASCLHADTLPELLGVLTGRELGLGSADLACVDLICFMSAVSDGGEVRRRVTEVWTRASAEHRLAFRWDAEAREHRRSPDLPPAPRESEARDLLETLCRENPPDLPAFRERLLPWFD